MTWVLGGGATCFLTSHQSQALSLINLLRELTTVNLNKHWKRGWLTLRNDHGVLEETPIRCECWGGRQLAFWHRVIHRPSQQKICSEIRQLISTEKRQTYIEHRPWCIGRNPHTKQALRDQGTCFSTSCQSQLEHFPMKNLQRKLATANKHWCLDCHTTKIGLVEG